MIRVVIVDDQEMFRVGLRTVLATQDGITVVGEAQDGREAVARVEQARPDVVLMCGCPSWTGSPRSRNCARGGAR
jgi:DNA-binding NarL/FixJ family response regulator